jgi:hypothetical protein
MGWSADMLMQDESEEDVGSSDEDDHRMAKPVFVLKADRETVLEKERAELEAMQLKEAEQQRLENRVVRPCCHAPARHCSSTL